MKPAKSVPVPPPSNLLMPHVVKCQVYHPFTRTEKAQPYPISTAEPAPARRTQIKHAPFPALPESLCEIGHERMQVVSSSLAASVT